MVKTADDGQPLDTAPQRQEQRATKIATGMSLG